MLKLFVALSMPSVIILMV